MHLTHNEVLRHYGVLGMKWGRRKGNRISGKERVKRIGEKIKKEVSDPLFPLRALNTGTQIYSAAIVTNILLVKPMKRMRMNSYSKVGKTAFDEVIKYTGPIIIK